jgi:HAD superfamily hydrolase (TIGR01509 family)
MNTKTNSNNPIDVLIFDLFGVIISFDEDIVYRRIARHCANPDDAFIAIRGLVSQEDLIRGRLTLEQLCDQLVAVHGLTIGLRDFETVWLQPYTKPMFGMATLLQSLSARYRLILLSNVDKYYWGFICQQHPEFEYFGAKLLSWDLGYAKPERKAFLNAIETAHTSASRCFFIDDKWENIEAAREVGLRGHRFVGTQDLVEALQKEGIALNTLLPKN